MKSEDMENGDGIIRENSENIIKNWWSTRTKNEKKGTCCLIGFALTILVCLAVYFGFFSGKSQICKSQECRESASKLLGFIDEERKPCDDFYRFACGNFLKNNSFDDPYSIQSVKIMMEEAIQADINKILAEEIDPEELASFNLAKKFYRACMNEKGIEKNSLKRLRQLFLQMGGWPVLEGHNWDPEQFLWTRAVRNLRAFGANFDFFFNVSVDLDREKPDRYILGIHDRFYSPSEISPNSKKAFLDYMVDVATQFNVKSWDAKKELNDVLDFILKLGKISEESKRSNNTNLYNLLSIGDLQKQYPTINWTEYIQGLLGIHEEPITLDDVVNVSELLYLKKLEILLTRTNTRTIANFMGWHIVQSLINYLPSKILDRAYDYLRKINGQFFRKPRWNICVEAARNRLSAPINIGYIERYFDDYRRDNVTILIRSVKHQFKRNLSLMYWLDQETKDKIMKMLASSLIKIYSDFDIFSVVQENSMYDSVKIEEDQLLKAVLDLDAISWDLHYHLLRHPVKDNWVKSQVFLSGLKVIYSAKENILKFPLGLLQGIYYNENRPDYMNYGLLGTVLAHQISHIFVEAQSVNVGESKAAEQRLSNWWSLTSTKNYAEKLECLSNQYAKFELKDVENIHANSVITREEDIADLAGLKVAYDAYNEKKRKDGNDPLLPGLNYSPKQLFWISSAIQFCSKFPARYLKDKYSGKGYHHSPNEFRVNGPLQNLDEFSYDFGCPQGSYMNPVDKCRVW